MVVPAWTLIPAPIVPIVLLRQGPELGIIVERNIRQLNVGFAGDPAYLKIHLISPRE